MIWIGALAYGSWDGGIESTEGQGEFTKGLYGSQRAVEFGLPAHLSTFLFLG